MSPCKHELLNYNNGNNVKMCTFLCHGKVITLDVVQFWHNWYNFQFVHQSGNQLLICIAPYVKTK